MSESILLLCIGSVVVCLSFIATVLYVFLKSTQTLREASAQQDPSSIYNIGHGLTPFPPDAYLSVEHISVTNRQNKPPKYNDAPPSYDEALKMAVSNSLQDAQSGGEARVHGVIPALPSRTDQ